VLGERVIGQEGAVRAVAEAVRRKRSGFGRERPLSLGFFGPTGTGKTFLAKTLAEVLFGSESAMIRLDMSEYYDKYKVSRLIGASPGYIGYEEGGQLTEPVRRRPYSVVLLDEIEKAHPDVWNVFLQVLDDGRLTDSGGRTVDFKNAIVIMTSNLAAEEVVEAWQHGEEYTQEEMREALKCNGMRPEFVNRISQVLVFHPLSPESIEEIVRGSLRDTSDTFYEEHGIEVRFSEEAVAYLAERGYRPQDGSRPLRGVIEREVENRLSNLLMEGKIDRGDAIEFAAKDDGSLGIRRTAKVAEER
jgi:ATP-dependent Clp protease ATP-binding subunit ClpA